jgi:hypothetical protein
VVAADRPPAGWWLHQGVATATSVDFTIAVTVCPGWRASSWAELGDGGGEDVPAANLDLDRGHHLAVLERDDGAREKVADADPAAEVDREADLGGLDEDLHRRPGGESEVFDGLAGDGRGDVLATSEPGMDVGHHLATG